jgi:hypothetical protein
MRVIIESRFLRTSSGVEEFEREAFAVSLRLLRTAVLSLSTASCATLKFLRSSSYGSRRRG